MTELKHILSEVYNLNVSEIITAPIQMPVKLVNSAINIRDAAKQFKNLLADENTKNAIKGFGEHGVVGPGINDFFSVLNPLMLQWNHIAQHDPVFRDGVSKAINNGVLGSGVNALTQALATTVPYAVPALLGLKALDTGAKVVSTWMETRQQKKIAQLNSETSIKINRMQIEAQMKREYLQIEDRAKDRALQWYLEKEKLGNIVQENEKDRALQWYLEKEKLENIVQENEKDRALQWYIEKEKLEFKQKLQEKRLAENRAITEYIKQVDLAMNSSNIDFQIWKAQQDRDLALELRNIDAKLTWELREYDRKVQLELLNRESEKSPIWITKQQLLSKDTNSHALTILYSPVTLGHSPSNNPTPSNFPKLEAKVQSKLSEIALYYTNHGRPIKFIGGAWTETGFKGEAAAQALFSSLRSIPVVILDAEVENNNFYLRHAFWGMNWEEYRAHPLVSELSWQEIQFIYAKKMVLQWLEKRQEYESEGKDPAEIDLIYKNQLKQFNHNLEIIDNEYKAKKAGININDISRPYEITDREIDLSGDYLAILHCIYLGLIADEYFLLYASLEALPI